MPLEKLAGLEAKFTAIRYWIKVKKERIISVTGKGGVGKTTLLRLLLDDLCSSFEIVIWVTISGDFQVGSVQDEIWRNIGSLNEEWVEKSTVEKAKCIYDVLSQNKFLLFLDDIWDPFELKSLGIPHPPLQGESVVILSSRNSQTCLEMGVRRNFKLGVLTDAAAWTLFRKMVGDDILKRDPKIIGVAKKISSLCSGLPILLCTVAGAMDSRRTYGEWKFALEVLGQNRELFKQLHFCYNYLPSDMVKFCFLYFCLFPEDFTIPKWDLIDFWISEDFFCHYDGKDSALNLGCKIIEILVRAKLFEKENDNCVKMLDLIRDFALDLVMKSNIHNFQLVTATKDDRRVRQIGDKYGKLGLGRILSMENIIQNIPDVTPDLLGFFLRRNPFIMIKYKPKLELTVLDLSKSSIEELPLGISELVSLQHLNLSHTYVIRLPIELKKLKNLRNLNLENNDHLRVIPRQVISSLSALQVLRMFRCGYSLQEEGDNIICATCMDISELQCLKRLKVLSITITCPSALKDFFSTSILPCCTHALSLEVFWGSNSLNLSSVAAMEHLFTLEIHHAEHLSDINVSFMMGSSFASLREVNVGKCSNLKDLSWLVLAPNLVILRVSYCPEMEEIISTEKLGKIPNPNKNLFAELEVLELESLSKLKSIYWQALPFQFIKKIQIIDCPVLKKLPLNSKSAKRLASNIENVEIIAEEDWWKQVEWEDVATEDRFHSCFKTPLVERNWPPRLSPLPRRSYVVRSESDGPRGCQQGFKQLFSGCLSGQSKA